MSILSSTSGGMIVFKNKPVDEEYLISSGWNKVDEDSEDHLVYGVNFVNARFPNIGIVPFGHILQSKNLDPKNVPTTKPDEDIYKSWCLYAKSDGGITSEGEYISFNTIWEPFSKYRITSIYELEYIMKSNMLC